MWKCTYEIPHMTAKVLEREGTSIKLYCTGWVFEFWHLLYVKCEYYVNKKKL
jgi:hypothetical protein